MPEPTLAAFIAALRAAAIVPRPPDEDWGEMIRRTRDPGRVCEIDEETYDWFLECLPPKYQNGGLFAFAEGAEAIRLFWQIRDTFFCRQLTWDETKEFCRLARISLPH